MSTALGAFDSSRLFYVCRRIFWSFLPRYLKRYVVNQFGALWTCFCPVCEDRVVKFDPLPKLYSRQLRECGSDLAVSDFETCNFGAYQCSHCGATDRDRLYALYLASVLPLNGAQRPIFSLLHIAPALALSRHLNRKYRIRQRTADLYQKGVDDRVDITHMDCYADESFDALICSHVLEHVEHDRRAMVELFRVLKPGGWGIVMVPIHKTLSRVREHKAQAEIERWRYFGQGDHVRVYTRDGFVCRLHDAGFVVLQLDRKFFEPHGMERCGLSESSVLYVVQKPSAP